MVDAAAHACTPAEQPALRSSWEFVVGGEKKNAHTSLADIGHFVARIVEDKRTPEKYVFLWGEELTQREVVGYCNAGRR